MIVLLISLSIGLFIGLAVWNVYQIFHAVPDEDRSFLDRPPTGFRVVWPLIQAFVHYFDSLISDNYRYATTVRLKRAGVEYCVSAEQFLAGKVISALVCGALMFIVLALLGFQSIAFVLVTAVGGFYFPELWLKECMDKRVKDMFRSLPFYLDVITLAVEAGSNLTGGITHAVQKSADGPLRSEFNRVLRDIRAGKTRAEAMRDMAERSGSAAINNVVSSMIQAEKSGSSLGPILRAQAEQLRNMRFLKAEKLAMEAPVKLLGPLVMFIFPTTFIVIGFVILSKAIQAGVLSWPPLVWAYTWPG